LQEPILADDIFTREKGESLPPGFALPYAKDADADRPPKLHARLDDDDDDDKSAQFDSPKNIMKTILGKNDDDDKQFNYF
jgi:hypothetical protein